MIFRNQVFPSTVRTLIRSDNWQTTPSPARPRGDGLQFMPWSQSRSDKAGMGAVGPNFINRCLLPLVYQLHHVVVVATGLKICLTFVLRCAQCSIHSLINWRSTNSNFNYCVDFACGLSSPTGIFLQSRTIQCRAAPHLLLFFFQKYLHNWSAQYNHMFSSPTRNFSVIELSHLSPSLSIQVDA